MSAINRRALLVGAASAAVAAAVPQAAAVGFDDSDIWAAILKEELAAWNAALARLPEIMKVIWTEDGFGQELFSWQEVLADGH